MESGGFPQTEAASSPSGAAQLETHRVDGEHSLLDQPGQCSVFRPLNLASCWKQFQDFAMVKNGKVQRRGRINLIGRLQLSTEKSRDEENQGILQLRILRTQEAIIKILKVRKKISNAQLQVI